MKFMVYRTSQRNYEDPPCIGAYLPDSERGKPYPTWYVDINTLDDLSDIQRSEKHVLVLDFDEPSIEIYNNYRE